MANEVVVGMNVAEQVLRQVTGIAPKPDEKRQSFLRRLAAKAQKLPEAKWQSISDDPAVKKSAHEWSSKARPDVEMQEFDPIQWHDDRVDTRTGRRISETRLPHLPEFLRRTPERERISKQLWEQSAMKRAAAVEVSKPAVVTPVHAAKPIKSSSSGPGESKRELIARMLQQPEGATAAELMNAAGWTKITVLGQARASDLDLVVRYDEKVGANRYFGSPKAGKLPVVTETKLKPKKKGN